MKILKYSIIAFLILIVVFFMIGMLFPSFSYEVQLEIKADVEKTWNFYVDEDRKKEWMPDLKELSVIEGTSGEIGSVHQFTFFQNGEEVVVTEKLTTQEKYRLYGYDLDSDVLEAHTSVRFESTGEDRCLMTATTEVKPKGLFLRSLFAVINGTFSRQAYRQYGEFKKLVERRSDE